VRRGALTAIEASERKTQYSTDTICLWQQRWVDSEKGRWTERWFLCVRRRLERVWCVPDHFTSQLMSNHGDFNQSLHRFNFRDDAACQCGSPEGSAEHLLFYCPLADQERQKLRIAVQTAGADWPCDLEFMTESEVMFQALRAFAHATLDRTDEG